ncbi:MAG TPA: hypothetical protein VFA70_04230 [Dehalococcoidia bacterium]|jgi:hypothetical protein|nr:hypothetical protein [Dehalococcoidia bacterium]
MEATQNERHSARSVRPAGAVLVGSVLAAIVWRFLLAPAILGAVNPATVTTHQRAILALGLLASALVTALGLTMLRHALPERSMRRLLTSASGAAFAGAALLAANIVLLLTGGTFLGLFLVFAVLTTGSWIATSVALFRGGILKWSVLPTALLSVLAMLSLVTGVAVIFVMFIATLPLGIGLVLRRQHAAAPASVVPVVTSTAAAP